MIECLKNHFFCVFRFRNNISRNIIPNIHKIEPKVVIIIITIVSRADDDDGLADVVDIGDHSVVELILESLVLMENLVGDSEGYKV